jgi:hypothetical protein
MTTQIPSAIPSACRERLENPAGQAVCRFNGETDPIRLARMVNEMVC